MEEMHVEKARADCVLPCHYLLLTLTASTDIDAVGRKSEGSWQPGKSKVDEGFVCAC